MNELKCTNFGERGHWQAECNNTVPSGEERNKAEGRSEDRGKRYPLCTLASLLATPPRVLEQHLCGLAWEGRGRDAELIIRLSAKAASNALLSPAPRQGAWRMGMATLTCRASCDQGQSGPRRGPRPASRHGARLHDSPQDCRLPQDGRADDVGPGRFLRGGAGTSDSQCWCRAGPHWRAGVQEAKWATSGTRSRAQRPPSPHSFLPFPSTQPAHLPPVQATSLAPLPPHTSRLVIKSN